MIEHLLHGSPVSSAGIELICAALGEIAARWPEGRPLRVLEIGADGGVTRRALDRLAQSGAAFRYVATSPDAEQAARLGFAVSAAPGASAACWRPGEPADDLGDGRFDIILAAHACARLRLDTAALSALRDLLAPGGLLIAVEPEPNPLWDLVFGRGSEWWRGADDGAGEFAAALRRGLARRAGDRRVRGYRRRRRCAAGRGRSRCSGDGRRATCNWPTHSADLSREPARTRRVCRSR